MSDLSWLNPTPHAIAVYASQPLSPVATQHSLPSGRYSLLGPDLHRLDRTSFAWRTHSITSSARASSVGGISRPSALAVLRLMTSSYLVGACTGRSAIDLDTRQRRRSLDRRPLGDARARGRVEDDANPGDARRDLLERFQPLCADRGFEQQKAGRIAARPRQALDEPGADRVGHDREHDRDRTGRVQQWCHGRAAIGEDD